MEVRNNQLYLGRVRATDLAKKYGTPIYVYEADTIRKKYLELKRNIQYKNLRIYFACKANTNLKVLKLLKSLGAGIETVSPGEIKAALKAGFKPKDIIYTSTSIHQKELKEVVRQGVHASLDSLDQIKMYGELNPGAKVGIRVNQGIGGGHHSHVITGGEMSKFGIVPQYLEQAKKLAAKYKLKITCIHQHIGSNVLDEKILLKAFNKLLETAKEFPDLESLDFGGGFGVPYQPNEKQLNLKKLGQEMGKRMEIFCKKYGRALSMTVEPGRFLVAEAGMLLAEVTEIKKNPTRTFVGVNSGFNHLVRPTMYGSYHEILNVGRVKGGSILADIVGNICESGDTFARGRKITSPKVGDILAILNAGAYGYVMASHYNSRALPKEILIGEKRIF